MSQPTMKLNDKALEGEIERILIQDGRTGIDQLVSELASLYCRASPAPSSDLVERLEVDIKAHEVTGNGNMRRVDNLREAASSLAAQAARIAELEEALRSFVFGDSDIADILWGDLPDDASMKTTAPLGVYRRARRALASIRGGA